MKMIIAVMSIILSLNALSSEIEVSATGRVSTNIYSRYISGNTHLVSSYAGRGYRKTRNLQTELIYKSWGEGKIRGFFSVGKHRKCPTVSNQEFFGLDNGIGEFDLYSNPSDLKSGTNRIGSMVVFQKSVILTFPEQLSFVGSNRDGFCLKSIHADTEMSFEIK